MFERQTRDELILKIDISVTLMKKFVAEVLWARPQGSITFCIFLHDVIKINIRLIKIEEFDLNLKIVDISVFINFFTISVNFFLEFFSY